MIHRILPLILVLLMADFVCLAQEPEANQLSKKEARKSRPYFIGIGVGLNRSAHRDFATSPLIYEGTMATFHINATRFDDVKETSAEFRISTGSQSISIAESFTATSVVSLFNNYQQLFRLRRFSNDQWNVKVGGNIAWGLNARDNPSLGNNSFGIEWFGTLFGSVKVTRDL
ncbi:MAG: hypothetical protein AAFO69_16030, partial [Bacteroidota bacterium]